MTRNYKSIFFGTDRFQCLSHCVVRYDNALLGLVQDIADIEVLFYGEVMGQ